MSRSAFRIFLGGVLLASACAAPPTPAGSSASTSVEKPMPAPDDTAALARLREAEQRRAPAMVVDDDLRSRNVEVRRASARALARIAGSPAREMLMTLLSDADHEVVAWAAYGLGFDCTASVEAREATVSALVARVVSFSEAPEWDAAFTAVARAVGSCALEERSQTTLVAWLDSSPSRARAASLGLGDLASRTKKLREETWVALFSRAAGGVSDGPLAEALYPVSRVENVPLTTVQRLAEVASARLADKGPFRLFAIRALGRAKQGGLSPLERVLLGDPTSFTLPERVEAARAAARLGDDGAVLLGRALDKLAAIPASTLASGGDDTQVLLAAISAVKDARSADKALHALAVAEDKTLKDPRPLRVLSLVRCAAAKTIRDIKPADPALTGCDLTKGFIGKRALLEVLGRGEMVGPNAKLYRDLLKDPDARTREAALDLLAAHAEIEDSAALLTEALRAKEPGVVSAAAEQIGKNPAIASPRTKKTKKKNDKPTPDEKPAPEPTAEPSAPPDPALVKALVAALERSQKENDPEMAGALIDATGALGQRSLLATVEPFCASSAPTAREHARNAIALMNGGKKPACAAPERAAEIGPEALATASEVTLRFQTEAGELTMKLDPTLAPATVARVTALVKRGYYDGNILHRVDPSFVVQFGSPFADGYAGPTDLPPLRCETSPRPFDELAVGVALSGRDTGSSQLFVMRARHPHLDGGYPIVGTASGGWDKIIEGDAIVKATVD